MASGLYVTGLDKILDGTIDPDTDTLKVMLVGTTYVYDPDHDFVDDISGDEITATNYTGGYAGASRKTATVAVTANPGSNCVDISIADLTWSSLGGAVNDTVGAAVLLFETGGSDATAIPIAYFDVADTPTNGSDFTLNFDATYNVRITTG